MTQNQEVVAYLLENENITTWDAIMFLHITRLSGRINELGKKGLEIPRRDTYVTRADGKKVKITEYWLSEEDKKRLKEGAVIV